MLPDTLRREPVVGYIGARLPVVLVASGKGGVGTSIVSSLLALACTSQGARVLLVDGNIGNGALHHLFGVRPERSLDSLYDSSVDVDDVLIPIDEQLTLVPSRPASAQELDVTAETRRVPFERLLASHHRFDCVIVDGGARLDNMMAVTRASTAALLVTDADRISLAANYAVIKVLSERARTVPCHVLVNRHDDTVARAAGDRLSDACRQFLDVGLERAGWLPDDPCLRAAIGAGMPIGDALDGSPAAHAMHAVMERMLPAFAERRTTQKTGISHSHPRN